MLGERSTASNPVLIRYTVRTTRSTPVQRADARESTRSSVETVGEFEYAAKGAKLRASRVSPIVVNGSVASGPEEAVHVFDGTKATIFNGLTVQDGRPLYELSVDASHATTFPTPWSAVGETYVLECLKHVISGLAKQGDWPTFSASHSGAESEVHITYGSGWTQHIKFDARMDHAVTSLEERDDDGRIRKRISGIEFFPGDPAFIPSRGVFELFDAGGHVSRRTELAVQQIVREWKAIDDSLFVIDVPDTAALYNRDAGTHLRSAKNVQRQLESFPIATPTPSRSVGRYFVIVNACVLLFFLLAFAAWRYKPR